MKTDMNTVYSLFRFQNKVAFLASALKLVPVTAGFMTNESVNINFTLLTPCISWSVT
jgi:hypothetical protein